MKKAINLLMLMCFLLCACGNDVSQTAVTGSEPAELPVDAVEAQTVPAANKAESTNLSQTAKAQTETTTVTGTGNYPHILEHGTTPAGKKNGITAEEAAAIADKAMDAIHKLDAENIIQYTTFGEFARLSKENAALSDAELARKLKEMFDETGKGMMGVYPYSMYVTDLEDVDLLDFKLGSPQPMTQEEINTFNNVFSYMNKMLKEQETDDESGQNGELPVIENGYAFPIDYTDSSIEDERQGKIFGEYIYVLKTDRSDSYHLDIIYQPYMQFSSIFYALGEAAKAWERGSTTVNTDVPKDRKQDWGEPVLTDGITICE